MFGRSPKQCREHKAPGGPGVPPNWSPAAKSGVGCAFLSRIWFTLSRGLVTELFNPFIDQGAIRDFGFVVTDSKGYFSAEQTDCATDTRTIADGTPVYIVENTCIHGRYHVRKEIFVDPGREVLLQRTRFTPRAGKRSRLRLFTTLSPRLGDQGMENTGWVANYRHWEMLFAQRNDHALALASTAPWLARSVGFAGHSDPAQDICRHGHMTWQYDCAENGHVGLGGEIDLDACNGEFVLALSLNSTPEAAAVKAVLSLNDPFEKLREEYVAQWRDWHKELNTLDRDKRLLAHNAQQRSRPDHSRPRVSKESSRSGNLYRTSMMVLRTHRSKEFAGAAVASLCTPWGEARGDDDMSGYHLVWPRDLAEEALGLLAGGAFHEVCCTLNYLRATQSVTGGWPQDMWLNGEAYNDGVQLDEAALPVILLDRAFADKALDAGELKTFWPMVRAAAAFIVKSGPATGQDRWENTPGLSPYTLATEISALLIAARMADSYGERRLGEYFRQTADLWNDSIEEWTYVTGTPLAERVGVDGYYVRICPAPGLHALLRKGKDPVQGTAGHAAVTEVVSPDALALVRFGLRAADDVRIENTAKVIDAVLKCDLPAGPAWRRYVGDDYGEHNDGKPFGGKNSKGGHGRPWPLLTGERGHYEVACGNFTYAKKLLAAMSGFASQVGFLSEQVWDQDDFPDCELFRGRASGSAMPLVWAHSEYVRLVRSIRDRRIFDLPDDTFRRYIRRHTRGNLALWRFDHHPGFFFAGRRLRIEVKEPAIVRFSLDGWKSERDVETRDTGIGIHYVDLPTVRMKPGDKLAFTFRWPTDHNRWEGHDFHLDVEAPPE